MSSHLCNSRRMRVNWPIVGGLFGLLVAVGLTMFPMQPTEVESQAAAWLAYFGVPSWGEGLTKTTDKWVMVVFWVLMVASVGLILFGLYRMRHPQGACNVDAPKAPWHDDLDRCHKKLVKYSREPYEYPVGHQEIAATQAFLPHIVRLCHVLDEHDISHPPLDTSDLTFTGTIEWGDFMARLMAVRGDLEEARKVYPKMLRGSGDD